MYKKLIITGCPRTGTTVIFDLLNQYSNILLFNELAIFHPKERQFNEKLELYCIQNQKELIQKNIINNNLFGIELVGDKHPDYCLDYNLMNNIIEKYNDCYFIFTYRNPCATVCSFLERTKREPNNKQTWNHTTIDGALDTIIRYNLNWSTILYPKVKNKIIVNYDYYNEKTTLLTQTLSNFLGLNFDLNIKNKKYFSNKNYNMFESKFSKNKISYIEDKFNPIKKHIYNLLFCA